MGKRVGAGALDLLLVLLATGLGERLAGGGWLSVRLEGWEPIWWLIVSLVYLTIGELTTSTSPGKAVFGLWVRTESNETPSRRQVLIRNGMRVFDVLPVMYLSGFLAVVVSRRNQRFGDMAANTIVTERPEGGPLKISQVDVLRLVAIAATTAILAFALITLG